MRVYVTIEADNGDVFYESESPSIDVAIEYPEEFILNPNI